VQRKAVELVEKHLKPWHVKPPPKDLNCNYLMSLARFIKVASETPMVLAISSAFM
jgi:hypothetical protein